MAPVFGENIKHSNSERNEDIARVRYLPDHHDLDSDTKDNLGVLVDKSAATDPGLRTYYNIYDAKNNMAIQLGHGFTDYVHTKFDLPHDKLQSELDVLKNTFSRGVVADERERFITSVNEKERALWRLRVGNARAVKSMEDTCYFVLREYDLLFLPLFNKNSMIPSLGAFSRRNLGGFGHAECAKGYFATLVVSM